jgi:hypothetical protein
MFCSRFPVSSLSLHERLLCPSFWEMHGRSTSSAMGGLGSSCVCCGRRQKVPIQNGLAISVCRAFIVNSYTLTIPELLYQLTLTRPCFGLRTSWKSSRALRW